MMETDRYGLAPLHKQAFLPKYNPDDPHSSRVKQWMAGSGALGALGGGALGALNSLQSSKGYGFKERALDALYSGGATALAGGAMGALSSIPFGNVHGNISERNENIKTKKTLRELQQAQLQQAQAAKTAASYAATLRPNDIEEKAVHDACAHYKIATGLGAMFGRGLNAAGGWLAKNPQMGVKGISAAKNSVLPGMVGAGFGAVGGFAGSGEGQGFSGAMKGGLAGGALGAGLGARGGWKRKGLNLQNDPVGNQPMIQGMTQIGQNMARRGQSMMMGR